MSLSPSPGIALFVYSTPDFAFLISKNYVRAKGRFVIDSYVGASYQGYDKMENRFHVTFADGASGYVGFETGKPLTPFFVDYDPVRDPLAYPIFLAHLPPAQAAKRLSLPGAVVGSTKAEVLASAWGVPSSKSTECEYGYVKGDDCERCRVKACLYNREVWNYPGGARLVFAEDQVTRVQR